MASHANQPGMFSATVARRRDVCDEHVEITLHVDSLWQAAPGQFVQVLCHDAAPTGPQPARTAPTSQEWLPASVAVTTAGAPLLRRPMSLGGLRQMPDGCEIDLLFRVVGHGTTWLASRRSGDAVDVMGPFGHGFTTPPQGCRALLVAGGIGLPPVRWLGERLSAAGVSCVCVVGSRDQACLPVTLDGEASQDGEPGLFVREFAGRNIPAIVTTDDGSCGMRGTAADGLTRLLAGTADVGSVRVFACGPYAMLRAIAAVCEQRRVSCEVAMEQMMACGMGTCQSCVVQVRDEGSPHGWRYRLCCSDGPVFDGSSIIWEQPGH